MPNKELAVSDDALAKMDEMANEEMIGGSPSYKIPVISLNGQEGIFKRYDPTNQETTDIGKKIEVIILRHRVRFAEYGDSKKKETWQRRTQEQDSQHNKFKLIHYDKGEKTILEESATGPELKLKYPEVKMVKKGIKMEQVEYCTLQGTNEPEIVKLVVKGTSLFRLFEYYSKFTRKGTDRSFLYVTTITPEKMKEGTNNFWASKYKKGKHLKTVKEINAIQTVQQNIYDNLKKIDDYYGNGGQVGEPHQIDEQPPLPTEAPPVEEGDVDVGEIFPEAPKENVGKKIKNKKLQATIEKAKNYKLKK